MQHGVQQRIVNVNLAVVADEPQFSKLVHEMTDARAGCPDHLCQGFLTDFNIDWLRISFLAEMGKKQQKSCKPPFAGITNQAAF